MDLRVEGLVHVYPSGVRALDGVDLVVPEGRALGLMGANGSGKTTLALHLVGLMRPTGGRVLVDGQDAAASSVARLAARVGLCFQDPDDQVFSGSVAAEVAVGPRNLGRRGEELRAVVDEALERTGIFDVADRNPYDLGAGRRRLLALASVLAMGTPALVLDEPTLGLDADQTDRVRAIVADLVREGRSVLLISHDPRFVAETCDRVAIMRAGRIVLEGSPAEVFAEGSWSVLREARVEPPFAARLGARLGLGATPTDGALIERLRAGTDRPGELGATEPGAT